MTLALLALSWVQPALADGPEISRSRGKRNGVLVFYPRVVPDPTPEHKTVQYVAPNLYTRLQTVAARTFPDTKLDIRPEPERVCLSTGCKGLNVGVLMGHHLDGCFAVALIGGRAEDPVKLVPWAGKLELSAKEIPFREMPEERVTVTEFVPCDTMLDQMNDAPIEEALRQAKAALDAR